MTPAACHAESFSPAPDAAPGASIRGTLEEPAGAGVGFSIERALAGAIMLDAERVLPLCAPVTLGMLISDHTAAILDAARRLAAAGRPVDGLTCAEALANVPPPPAGWAVYISDAIAECPAAGHAEGYVADILAGFRRRRLAVLGRQLATATSDEAIADAVEAIKQAESDAGQAGPEPLDGQTMIGTEPPPHAPVLANLFDMHALVELVGQSKSRKSFAALQIALSLAAGRDVFGFQVADRFRVLVADLELSEADIRRRTWRMARALNILPEDVAGRLTVLPLAGMEHVCDVIERAAEHTDVLLLDPLYALCTGGEAIEDLRGPLRWLRRLAMRRAAVMYLHHDPKGVASERDVRDRGSGSGITGRACDARITLTPHRSDPDFSIVAGFMCRSYVTPEPSVWTFEDGCFRPSDMPPETERAVDRRARQDTPKSSTYVAAALRILGEKGPLQPRVFKRTLREELTLSKHAADDLVASMTGENGQAKTWITAGFPARYFIGLASQVPRDTKRESRETL